MSARTAEANVSLTLPLAAKPVITKIYELISAGRAADALPRLAQLEELGRANPIILNLTKGTILVDIAQDLGDIDLATRGISLIKDVKITTLPESVRPKHWYNLGNGYGALYHIKKIRSGVGRALDDDFNRAKRCYREAMSLGAGSPEPEARLYTNYGILLRTVGRHVEEIGAYDEVLRAVPDFAMALWHKAKGLRWYSRLVERPTKRSVLLEARHLYRKSLEAGLEPGRKLKAEKELAELERILKDPKTTVHKHTQHVADSDIERKYIKFCVDNRLYLHPCPITSHQAYQDWLSVRFPTAIKDEFFELRSNPLALIKLEYIAARFLLFLSRHNVPDLSFVERGSFLPSVGGGEGRIYLQMLNLSFRAAYAILDKIGYFLNEFCKLGRKAEKIHFREDLFLANGGLRSELTTYDGLQLAALLDLAREFSKDEPLVSLRELRNKLEHRCLGIRRQRNAEEETSRAAEDTGPATVDYGLNEEDVQEATFRLFRVVRAAIFYLFWFVRSSVKPPSPQPYKV